MRTEKRKNRILRSLRTKLPVSGLFPGGIFPAGRSVLTAFLLAFAIALFIPADAKADNYIRNNWTDNGITREQYDAVMQVLRSHTGPEGDGSVSPMYDTGLTFDTKEDAIRFCFSMKELFLGQDDFGLCYNENGYSEMTAEIIQVDDQGTGLKYHAYGEKNPEPTVYAGWLPGASPFECLRQHETALNVVRAVAANAPEEEEAMYRYFFDWLREHVIYDDSLQKKSHSAYSALFESTSVCEGYSRAFSALCYQRGKYCRNVVVDGSGPGPYVHERNLVFVNGEPKWIDVTWGDATDGDPYEYFLFDVDLHWRTALGL